MSLENMESFDKSTKYTKLREALHNLPAVSYQTAKSKNHPSNWSLAEKLNFLRKEKLGRFTLIESPKFWQDIHPELSGSPLRSLLHLDYTASAQGLAFLERYMVDCMKTYANTHTETSATGRSSTQRFHQAIESIREHVGAGQDSFVISSGYGATGAIEKVQKLLGLYFSPKGQTLAKEKLGIDIKEMMAEKFVVFVGPSEHHSNDVTWQDAALCKFVRIKAIPDGPEENRVCLDDLEKQLKAYDGYTKIGSFSAASNVTGMSSHLKAIGEKLRSAGALFMVDYAASGPYADINMDRDGIDAIFLSMHKNIGGANIGLLVGKNHIYDHTVNPSFGGGGTVSAVTPWEYHFYEKIEDREYPGTPAIRQLWQAALSFQLKDWLGCKNIDAMDKKLSSRMVSFMEKHPMIQLLGNRDPELRYPIFSFLVKHGDKMLHHTFVAALFNDLFGIQARSGCACAGPFGHELLKITKELSDKYVQMILNVLNGFKPGWTRIGTHYTLDEKELDYVYKALGAIAYFGALYLDHYSFDPYTGSWSHEGEKIATSSLSFEQAVALEEDESYEASVNSEEELYRSFDRQWQEFLLLSSCKIAQLIIAQAKHLQEEDSMDMLAMACLPVLKQFLENEPSDPSIFIQELATATCHLIAPPGADPEACREDIGHMLNAQIFAPQDNPELYEAFDSIEKGVDFFYVRKGSLSRPIDIKQVKSKESCQPCL